MELANGSWNWVTDAWPEPAEASEDERLIRDCLRGDERAWASLIDRYRNLIFSIPVRNGFSREDASEIFQQVCLILLSELPRLRERRTLAAWLIQVTVHECSHWKKKQSHLSPGDVRQDNPSISAHGKGMETMLHDLRREQILRETVSELTTRCKRLIEMLFFATPAVSYDEVARTLGIARNSVGFIRMRCLERLRRSLEKKGFE
jgi:RNA polymerase sigma factor (sigma-70 family)